MLRFFLAILSLLSLAHLPARADMLFNVSFTAQALTDLSSAEQSLFTSGLSFWDDVIINHRDGMDRSWTLTVDTFSQAASMGSVLLGQAGPSGLTFSDPVDGVNFVTEPYANSQFIISTGGAAKFNVHPDAGPLSLDTIKHEIGHALGFGTLWEDNEVYNDGIAGNSYRTLPGGTPGEYVGAAALAAYQSEFVGQSGVTFVPVELGGGEGTAHGHWDESDDFGQTPTGVVHINGLDRQRELMTGWAYPGDDFLSNTTIQSLFDIGFNVNNVTAVPEPSSVIMLSAFALVGARRLRRKRA